MSYLRPAVARAHGLILRRELSARWIEGPHHAANLNAFRRHLSSDVVSTEDTKWSKHVRPARLFKSVMGRPPVTDPVHRPPRHSYEPPLTIDPHALPHDLSTTLRLRLTDCVRSADISGAAAVLDNISETYGRPSAHAFTLAVDAAVAAGDLDQAERYVRDMSSTFVMRDGRRTDAHLDTVRYSKTKVAMAYAQAGNYEHALRIMKLSSILKFANRRDNRQAVNEAILNAVEGVKADLGRSSGAWGVIIRALCGIGLPHAAVAVGDSAVKCGVRMTDGLLQVTIDALRTAGRWQDAVWLFDTSIKKGLKPSERSISSALRALTCRNARMVVNVGQVERVAALAENPSLTMLSNCLAAFSAIGAVAKVEQVFRQFTTISTDTSSKRYFSARMAAYSNYVDLLDDSSVNEVRKENVYEEINSKATECWNEFLETYRLAETKCHEGAESSNYENEADSRATITVSGIEISKVLRSYLRTKVQCFKTEEALAVLENVSRQKRFPNFRIEPDHIATVLAAIELCSDVGMLQRILNVMGESGVRHDIRSVAFTVGTFLSDGDLERSLRTVREEGHAVVAEAESALSMQFPALTSADVSSTAPFVSGSDPAKMSQTSQKRNSSFKGYFPALLLRRLSSLSAAFEDVGVGRVPDLEALMRRLNNWPRAESRSAERMGSFPQ